MILQLEWTISRWFYTSEHTGFVTKEKKKRSLRWTNSRERRSGSGTRHSGHTATARRNNVRFTSAANPERSLAPAWALPAFSIHNLRCQLYVLVRVEWRGIVMVVWCWVGITSIRRSSHEYFRRSCWGSCSIFIFKRKSQYYSPEREREREREREEGEIFWGLWVNNTWPDFFIIVLYWIWLLRFDEWTVFQFCSSEKILQIVKSSCLPERNNLNWEWEITLILKNEHTVNLLGFVWNLSWFIL